MTGPEYNEAPWQNVTAGEDPQLIREAPQPAKAPAEERPEEREPGAAAQNPEAPRVPQAAKAPGSRMETEERELPGPERPAVPEEAPPAPEAGCAPAAPETAGQAGTGTEQPPAACAEAEKAAWQLPQAAKPGGEMPGAPRPERRGGKVVVPPSWLEFEYEATEQDWLEMLQDLNGFQKTNRRVYAVMAALLAALGAGFLFWGFGRRRVDPTTVIYGAMLLCMAGYFVFRGRPASLARLQLRQMKKRNGGVLPTTFNLRLSPRHLLQITPDATSDVSTASFSGLRMEPHTVFILHAQNRRFYWLPGRLFANPEGGPRLEAMQNLLPAWRDAEQARILARPAEEPAWPQLPMGETPAFAVRWQQTEQDVVQLARGAQRNALPAKTRWLGGILGTVVLLLGIGMLRVQGFGSLVAGVAMLALGGLCLLVPLSGLSGLSASGMQNQLNGWQLKRQCSPACLAAGQRWLLFALDDGVNRVPYRLVNRIRVDGSLVFLVYDGNLVLTIPCRAFGSLGQAEAFVAFVRQKAAAQRGRGR